MVDLRNCKPGDKLISKHGLVLEYVRPLPEDGYMDHEVRYPDEAPYKGSIGTRTHEGYVMRRKRLEEDHDIVRIVSSEVMKVETLEEAAERLAIHFNIDFINGAKWQQERSYSEEDLDMFRKFMIQEQNFSKSCLDVFIEQFKKK
jgi:hypothetical protein